MNFTQQVLTVIDERVLLQCAASIAELEGRQTQLQEALEKVDEVWTQTKRRFDRSLAESTSAAWTNQISTLHETRRQSYERLRAGLQAKLQQVELETSPSDYDRARVARAVQSIEAEIQKYCTTLSIKRRQLEFLGEYGETDKARWLAETRRFVTKNPAVIAAVRDLQLVDAGLNIDIDWFDFAACAVDESIVTAASLPDVATADGIGFERLCATLLESAGWAVTHTPVTGDQGVDLLARRADLLLAIQCKNTSQPVSNSAV